MHSYACVNTRMLDTYTPIHIHLNTYAHRHTRICIDLYIYVIYIYNIFCPPVRSWAYATFGEERAVLLVAMSTPQDMRANAEHIRMADQFVEVPGGSSNHNYANVQLVVEVGGDGKDRHEEFRGVVPN